MGVINPGIWATRLTGKDAQPLQSVKTIITAVLMITSGLKNSQNKWLPVILLIHGDDDDDDVIKLFNDSINSSI
jgi:sulfite exporter TauE/SafE